MIEIPLTHGKVALIDDEDAHLAGLRWHAVLSGNIWYALHTTPRGPDGRQRTVSLHRAVLSVVGQRVKVDHVDGNGLDCRRANLRPATQSENCCNRGPSRRSKSGYKGVWLLKHGRWQAQIRHNRKLHYLGTFDSSEEAAAAYDAAARSLHGAFAWANLPAEVRA